MADQKLTELTAASSLAATDIIYAVIDPSGTPAGRKASFTVVATLMETTLSLSNFTTGTLAVARGGTGSTSFTAGSIIFSNGSILTQDNTNLNWDDTNNKLKVKGLVDVFGASASTPSSAWSFVNHVVSVLGEETAGGGTIIAIKHAEGTAGTSYEFTGYRSRGTLASPSDCAAGDRLGRYAALARANNSWYIGGYMDFICDTGFGGSNNAPTYWRVSTLQAGELHPQERIRVNSSGEMGINLGESAAVRQLEVQDTNAQLRLDYTFGSIYAEVLVNSSGDWITTVTGTTVAFNKSNSSVISYQIFNQSNASGTAHSRVWNLTGGSSGGDPYTRYTISGIDDWAIGVDNSVGDYFKISNNSTLGTNDFLTITTAGRVGLSASPPTGGGTPVLALGQATGDPSSIGSNTAGLIAKDSGGTCELYAWDEAGNVTLLSPHASLDEAETVGIVLEKEDLAPSVSVSANIYTGVKVYRYTGPSGKTQVKQIQNKPIADWDKNQDRLLQENQQAIAQWKEEKTKYDADLLSWSQKMETYRSEKAAFDKGDGTREPALPIQPDLPGPEPAVYQRKPKPRWR